ncbi:hypothetical protein PBY51_005512 [Eleginops maclovinus]|uniref:Uncharacterized protein n=1 Tax=Eleginops maclovinus TaxID=56733 RepID=A0AAN7X6H8_ELEMC|nr:hypothetical protein PBY51_005512 [Eleginops maclovinus]
MCLKRPLSLVCFHGVWAARVYRRSAFHMFPIICPDPAGRGVSCPSHIHLMKPRNHAEAAAALLEVVSETKMLPINPDVTLRVAQSTAGDEFGPC